MFSRGRKERKEVGTCVMVGHMVAGEHECHQIRTMASGPELPGPSKATMTSTNDDPPECGGIHNANLQITLVSWFCKTYA